MSNSSHLTPRGIYGGLFCFVCGTVLFIPGYANMSSSGLIDIYSSTLVYICFGLDGLLLCLAILLCIIKHNVIYIHICIGILITALSSISAILGAYWNTILTSDDYFHWDYSTSSIYVSRMCRHKRPIYSLSDIFCNHRIKNIFFGTLI